MNKIYALVWNQAQGCWNVTHEGARRLRRSGSGKGLIVAAASILALAGLPSAFALPTGGAVVSGSADISTQGNHILIDQKTDKVITNWDYFDVDVGQSVTFKQPSTTSIALNRVLGNYGTMIQGTIKANGQVFLINPNGMIFLNTANVNVGGLVASTQGISDSQFNAGTYQFSGTSKAPTINLGNITAADGGNVALLGANVRNDGIINAQNGRVALGAGKTFTVSFDGDNLLDLQVDAAAINALVSNSGRLRADGGQVLMTAKSAGAMTQAVVNNTGTIEANTLSQKAGRITLDGGDTGVVNVGGVLTASASGKGDGGVIETRGASTKIQDHAFVSTQAKNGQTGTWKIESSNIGSSNIEAGNSGSNLGDMLSYSLRSNNIELTSSKGDIVMNDSVSWDSGNQLILSSAKNIQLNGDLTANGDNARIELEAKNHINLNNHLELAGTNSSLGVSRGKTLYLSNKFSFALSGTGSSMGYK